MEKSKYNGLIYFQNSGKNFYFAHSFDMIKVQIPVFVKPVSCGHISGDDNTPVNVYTMEIYWCKM